MPITIPPAFGPFRFYGTSYTQLSVCSNGFVMPGSYTTTAYSNAGLPSTTLGAPAICLNWDDLYPTVGGGVKWMHDTLNHALVVEYDSVAYYSPQTTMDKFELVIYDTTVHSGDNNNVVVAQYYSANNYVSSTMGIQDPTQAIAIQCLYNGTYTRGCAPMAAGRAIKYCTDLPTGIAEEDNLSGVLANTQFIAYPNPFKGMGNIAWNVKAAGNVVLKVYDPSGRVVRNLVQSSMKPGRYTVTWDGKANDGRMVSAGIYFYKLETASGKAPAEGHRNPIRYSWKSEGRPRGRPFAFVRASAPGYQQERFRAEGQGFPEMGIGICNATSPVGRAFCATTTSTGRPTSIVTSASRI